MIRNVVGVRILPPEVPEKQPKGWRFPQKTTKFGSIRANIRTPFKTPSYPPLTKVTWSSEYTGEEIVPVILRCSHNTLSRNIGDQLYKA